MTGKSPGQPKCRMSPDGAPEFCIINSPAKLVQRFGCWGFYIIRLERGKTKSIIETTNPGGTVKLSSALVTPSGRQLASELCFRAVSHLLCNFPPADSRLTHKKIRKFEKNEIGRKSDIKHVYILCFGAPSNFTGFSNENYLLFVKP